MHWAVTRSRHDHPNVKRFLLGIEGEALVGTESYPKGAFLGGGPIELAGEYCCEERAETFHHSLLLSSSGCDCRALSPQF
jgi:hypothetical protein